MKPPVRVRDLREALDVLEDETPVMIMTAANVQHVHQIELWASTLLTPPDDEPIIEDTVLIIRSQEQP